MGKDAMEKDAVEKDAGEGRLENYALRKTP